LDKYISFVVAARNDTYGENFLGRFQIFIKYLVELLETCKLESEIVVVEWNPPEDRKSLKDAVCWPDKRHFSSIRIIQVPKEVHNKIHNSDKLPMFEYYAKNVGIRRSRGEFILVTNPDLIFSEELIKFLAQKQLKKDAFYRLDRYDFRGNIDEKYDVRKVIKYAKKHVFRVNYCQQGNMDLGVREINSQYKYFYYLLNLWPGTEINNKKDYLKDCVCLDYNNGVYGGIHTNTSGDFILTYKKNWEYIHGFPEFSDTFTHLDSYGCHQLRAIGLKQMLFLPPCMIFHKDHSRIEQKNRPTVSSDKWITDLKQIRDGQMVPIINNETWGLPNFEFNEIEV
jgi:hypothetical protein